MRETPLFARALGCAGVVLTLGLASCDDPPEAYGPPDTGVIKLTEPTNSPPISGGTMLVTAHGELAVAADPDHDMVWVVGLHAARRLHAIALEPGDEPGRVVEDSRGLVHVVLRGGGAIATVDPTQGTVVRRVSVCDAPRGLAYEEGTEQLYVACAQGELLTLSAEDGSVVRTASVAPDLRDVAVVNGRVVVTRLRSAEVLSVDAYGAVLSSARPPSATLPPPATDPSTFSADVAWRTIAVPGGVLMVHQRALDTTVTTDKTAGYGSSPCSGIVHAAVARFEVTAGGEVKAPAVVPYRIGVALPVDVAMSADGKDIVVAGAGSRSVAAMTAGYFDTPFNVGCGPAGVPVGAAPVAVAFAGEDVVIQTRAPAAILVPRRGLSVQLGLAAAADGHRLFHTAPFGTVACASCHPEGREDGHVWTFEGAGPRRSQSLRVPLGETLPLHWEGDLADLGALMDEVFVHRMGGEPQDDTQKEALATWLDTLPALPPLHDPDDEGVARGKALFEREDVGCASCHTGPLFTNNKNEAIGKGEVDEVLQVPSLAGVAWRTPLMHDGCAATLRDRFEPECGGTKHGDVSMLSPDELEDLIAYLESL